MIELRPYQAAFTRDISQALRLHRRVVGTMATGSGKGTVAAHMAATAAARGHRVYVLAHRKERRNKQRIELWKTQALRSQVICA